MFLTAGDAAGLPGCENIPEAACGGAGTMMVHEKDNATDDGVVYSAVYWIMLHIC